MRPRTKSVVTVREYFRQDGSGAPEQDEDADEDNWMAAALLGAPRKGPAAYGAIPAVVKPRVSFSKFGAVSKKSGGRARTSTLDSWEGTDVEDDLETEDEDDDEDVDGIARIRTCSHDRRISFDDDVDVVEIPARSSFDADYKRRVWYTSEELRQQAY